MSGATREGAVLGGLEPTPSGARPTASAPGRNLLLAMLLVGLIGVAAALPGVWVRATYGAQTSADEPHYLLTAISLIEDGDLNLRDEFREQAYRPFHEPGLPPQGGSVEDERLVAPHDPLLPVLLALPWRVGGWEAAKALLVVVNGALGALLVWTAVRWLRIRLPIAASIAGLFVASAPLAAYGSQLYPELPAALAVLSAVAAGFGRANWTRGAVVVASLVALPWLAVKYVPVAAALCAVVLVRWWRGGDRRAVWLATGVLALAAVGYLVAHLAWYGGVTPYATSDFFAERGGQFSVVGTRPDPLGRSRRLIGLLVDDQFGLTSWQPAYLLLIPGVAGMLRRRPNGWPLLVAPLAAGWLSATFVALTMQGWWFPGRQVVVVLPLAVLAIAWLVERGGAWFGAAVGAGLFGVVAWLWLVVDGLNQRLVLIVDFASTTNPLHQVWQKVLPNYLDITPRTWVLHAAWLAAAGALAVAGWRSARSGSRGFGAGAGTAARVGAAHRTAD